MSGEYKYAEYAINPSAAVFDPTIGVVVLGTIVALRAAEAVIEEGRRLDKQEQVLVEGLNASKCGLLENVDKLGTLAADCRDKMLPHDVSRIEERLTALRSAIGASKTHASLASQSCEAATIHKDLYRAVEHKIMVNARARGEASPSQRERFESLRERFAGLGSPADGGDDGPRDPIGARTVRQAVAAAAASLQSRDIARQDNCLKNLDETLDAYETAQAEAIQRKSLLEEAATQLSALVAGLTSDDVVMRWQAGQVDDLARSGDVLKQKLLLAREDVSGILETAASTAAQIVHEANIAQIKADQRDYVAAGIGAVLQEMGYMVQPAVPEHPEHPASAMIVTAASPSGRVIAVSVPVEGQVWYNVEGFVKSTEAAVGGGTAAVCDEAEEVITQMHEALAAEYHIDMGELMWEGKDPNRHLRQARSTSQDNANGAER